MLKDGVVLLVISLIVVGAILVWWTQAPAHPLTATVAAAPEVQEPVPAPKPAPQLVIKPASHPAEEAPVVVASVPVAEPVPAAAVVERDPLPFPAVEQISTGVHESSITSKYGDPALSAMTSRDGHMVETLVYSRGDGGSSTIIRIEDGKVSGAYSQSGPTVPAGFSAPRHLHNQ